MKNGTKNAIFFIFFGNFRLFFYINNFFIALLKLVLNYPFAKYKHIIKII